MYIMSDSMYSEGMHSKDMHSKGMHSENKDVENTGGDSFRWPNTDPGNENHWHYVLWMKFALDQAGDYIEDMQLTINDLRERMNKFEENTNIYKRQNEERMNILKTENASLRQRINSMQLSQHNNRR